jgi:hypothetical protein
MKRERYIEKYLKRERERNDEEREKQIKRE